MSRQLVRHAYPGHFQFRISSLVDAFGVSVVDARDDLILQPFLDVGSDGMQTRDTIDDVNCQIEAVDLIENRKFERSVDAALFLVPAYMYVVVIPAPVTKFVNERSVGMEVEDHRLVGGKQRIEVPVGEPMRMFGLRHEAEKIHNIDESYLQIGEVLLQDCDRRKGLHGRDVAGTSHHGVGLLTVVAGRPVPDADAFGAVGDRIFHGEVLKMLLLIRDDDVDVIPRPKAVIRYTEQAVCVRR